MYADGFRCLACPEGILNGQMMVFDDVERLSEEVDFQGRTGSGGADELSCEDDDDGSIAAIN